MQQTMLKKFKHNKNIWMNFASYYFQSGDLKEGRNILNRSLQSLPAKERMVYSEIIKLFFIIIEYIFNILHISFISKVSYMCYEKYMHTQ